MSTFYLVQHGEKQRRGGDPGLTVTGRAQALWTGSCLRGKGITQVWSSPLRRSRETAEILAAVLGLPVRTDPRLRERMSWDGSQPFDTFQREWSRSNADRDYRPLWGDSSRDAGDRLAGFLREHADDRGNTVIVSHGGVTVDLVRTLFGEAPLADRPELLTRGVAPCSLTTVRYTDAAPALEQFADDRHLSTPEAPTGAFIHQVGGYRPRWLYTAREILDVHGERLSRLAGRSLEHTWVLWDRDLDEWYSEGPVVFQFAGERLTACHRRTGECSLSWDDLDPTEPVDAGDESLRLCWRADVLSPLRPAVGHPLRLLDLVEDGDPEGRWLISGLDFGFDDPHVVLANVDGRNALSTAPTAGPEPRRRVRVS